MNSSHFFFTLHPLCAALGFWAKPERSGGGGPPIFIIYKRNAFIPKKNQMTILFFVINLKLSKHLSAFLAERLLFFKKIKKCLTCHMVA